MREFFIYLLTILPLMFGSCHALLASLLAWLWSCVLCLFFQKSISFH